MSAQTQPAAPRREDAPLGVLVGVDGSDQSVSAARWAQREAALRGEPLTEAAEAVGIAVDRARVRGVEALAYRCIISQDGVTLAERVPMLD